MTELLLAGAEYLSDEFVVLDGDGRVHPYRRPLHLRDELGMRTLASPEDFGANGLSSICDPAVLLSTWYEPGAQWAPERLSPGEATLRLLSNMPAARRSSEGVIQVLTTTCTKIRALEGPRGEACDTVSSLLESIHWRA